MSAAAYLAAACAILCVVVLVWRRAEVAQLARTYPLALGAASMLGALALWLTRRQPAPTHTPQPAPPAPKPLDYAHDLPLDTTPDAAAPLATPPDPDLGDLVLRLDERARRRAGGAE